ncbi:MAG: hypothetical protein SFY66_10710 [Oculatellaceae cyanobacterium bins.114]|nr:hypothetical protein [Oculatellaceae cyanobacterium bins.114]
MSRNNSKSEACCQHPSHFTVKLRQERGKMMQLYVNKLAQGICDRFNLSLEGHELLNGLLTVSCEGFMVDPGSGYDKFSLITFGEQDIEAAEVLALKGLISFVSEDQQSAVLNWFLIENC